MEKKVENLSVHDYGEVEDLIGELLKEQFGIVAYSFDNLEKGVEYVAGTINIVKLGDNPDSLKHKQPNGEEWLWSNDIEVTDSYRYTTYYELEKMNDLCQNTLSGSCSETYHFNEILKRQ